MQIEFKKKVAALPDLESLTFRAWALRQKKHISAVHQHCLRSTLHFMFISDKGPTLETLDFTFYIGSTPTFSYFDLYLNTAYAAHYILCFSKLETLYETAYFAFYIGSTPTFLKQSAPEIIKC